MEATEVTPQRFIHIDEDGYFKMEELRVADVEIGRDWLSQIEFDPKSAKATTRIEESTLR